MTGAVHETAPDFLARVVDKALGTGAGIAPRVRSVFEPAPEAPAIATPSWPVEPARAVVTVPKHDDVDDDVRPSRASNVTDFDRQPPINDPPSGSYHLALATTPAASMPPLGAPLAALRPRVPAAVASPQASADALSIPASDAAAAPVSANADVGASTKPIPVSVPALPPTRHDRAARADGDGRSLSFNAGEPAMSLVPLSSAVAERLLVAAPSVPGPQRDTQTAAPPSSVINVTIGRVEVRATPSRSAAPAVPAGHGTRPLSLDEYLKRRGER
jgi:hypothetical protein